MADVVSNKEALHATMYRAHHQMRQAGEELHRVVVSIHAMSRYTSERRKWAAVLSNIESARDQIDVAMDAAGTGQTEMIRLTGCDGTCKE